MKEIKIVGTYQCGHSWTSIYTGLSAHERKCTEREFKENVCPKCGEKERDDT